MNRNMLRGSLLLAALVLAAALTGCGDGGGTPSPAASGGAAAPALFDISLRTAAPAVEEHADPVPSVSASVVSTPDSAYEWVARLVEPAPRIAHVYMDIRKIALLPAEEPFGGGDMDGELNPSGAAAVRDGASDSRFIEVVPDSPVRIDLLEEGAGSRLARFLDRLERVPAGTYDKIRVFYDNVVVEIEGGGTLPFHPTAHSRFDIHFLQGRELVIPDDIDATTPEGRDRIYQIVIDVTGLKIRIVNGEKGWENARVILRPQLFAEFVLPVRESLAGAVANVRELAGSPGSGTFDVSLGDGKVVPAAFDNTTAWSWSDDVAANSSRIVPVDGETAAASFRDRAIVRVTGGSGPDGVFHASDVLFSFPDRKEGVVDAGWNAADVFFFRSDSSIIYPMPGRYNAYYDNAIAPYDRLTQAAIVDNARVAVRGYNVSDGIFAFWLSVGAAAPVP